MTFTRILVAATALCLLPVMASAQSTSAAAANPPSLNGSLPPTLPGVAATDTTPVTKGQLAELVRQVLVNNPDILMQAAKKLHDAEDQQSQKDAKDALDKNRDQVFNDPNSPSIGNTKNPDVTLVEFFDYHCGYCHQLLPAIVKLSDEDKKVRIVFKEYPILSEDSVTASRAALAVFHINPAKYFEFHQALMHVQGKFDEVSILDVAQKMGIDSTRLKLEMDKPEITAELDADRNLGDQLQIHGTPAIILNDEIYPGAVSYEDLKKLVAAARAESTPDGRPKS